MKSRTRRLQLEPRLQLDSLMDILACTVGIVLLVVLFSVLEFRGTPLPVTMPLAQEPPAGAASMTIICSNNRVRLMEREQKIDELLEGFEHVSLYSLGGWVAKANARDLKDKYFTYGLNYEAGEFFWGYLIRYPVLEMVVKERPGFPGETMEDLELPESYLRTRLATLDPDKIWFTFAVDEESLDLFRSTRLLVREAGFSTGWDPIEFIFPHRFNLLGRYYDDPLAPNASLSTQQ